MRSRATISRVGAGIAVVLVVAASWGIADASAARGTATVVTVTFRTSTFVVSRSGVDAGATTFVIRNRGPRPHALSITGPGLKHARTAKIASGKSATLTVTLRTGAYMLADALAHDLADVKWVQVSPAVKVTATGNGSVVQPITVTTGMSCD